MTRAPLTGYRRGGMAKRYAHDRLDEISAFLAYADALELNFTHDPRAPVADPPGWRERYTELLAPLFAPKGSNLAHARVQLGQGVLKALVRKVTQATRRFGRDKAFRVSADVFHDQPDTVVLGDQDGQAGDQDGVLCGQAGRDLEIIHDPSSFFGCGDLKEARPDESPPVGLSGRGLEGGQ